MAKLYFRYAAMNAGKSTALIQIAHNYEHRDGAVLIVKPAADTKHINVLSRMGAQRAVDINALPDTDLFTEIQTAHNERTVDAVIVDEAQFLHPRQIDQLFRVAVLLDIPVLAYGLRTDFETHSFPGSARLLEIAHSLEEMKTICRCKRKAIFNGRMIDGKFVQSGPQVAIDGQHAEYESLCGACYIAKVGTPTAKDA